MRDNSFDKQFLRTITMTEDEECVLGDMISFFNDMGWIDDSTQQHMTHSVRNTANLVHSTTNQLIHPLGDRINVNFTS